MAGEHFGQGQEKSRQIYDNIIAYWLDMSRITCKWFGCCGIAKRVSKWNWGNLRRLGQKPYWGGQAVDGRGALLGEGFLQISNELFRFL